MPISDQSQPLTVFISYSHSDLNIADAMVKALEKNDFQVLIDRRDLPYGEEWQDELEGFIRQSDTVIWLVSPESVKSDWCNWELGVVGQLKKRLIPIKIRETSLSEIPKAIGKIHLLPTAGIYTPSLHFSPLVEALNTDHIWLKDASRLADRARQWQAKKRDSDLLLRGAALKDAETWKSNHPLKAPSPTVETLELIFLSRQATTRRQRYWTAGSLFVAIGAIALAVYAYSQQLVAERNEKFALESQVQEVKQRKLAEQREIEANDARRAQERAKEAEEQQRRIAEDNEKRAVENARLANENERIATENEARATRERDTALITQSRFLADLAIQQREQHDNTTSMLLSLAGLPDGSVNRVRPHVGIVEQILYTTISINNELSVLTGHRKIVEHVVVSPDGKQLLTASKDYTIRLWDASSGALLQIFTGHKNDINHITFSPDGKYILSASADWTARLWDKSNGAPLKVFSGHRFPVRRARFGPYGKKVITASWDDTAIIWDVKTGAKLITFAGHGHWLWDARLSHDGQYVLTSSDDKTARLWDANSGTLLKILSGHKDSVSVALFSPDGKMILTVSLDATARLWNAVDGTLIKVFRGHKSSIYQAVFSLDGRSIVTSSWDKTARIWDIATGQVRYVLSGHSGKIESLMLSTNGKLVLTSSDDGTARVWDAEKGTLLRVLKGHVGPVTDAVFSPSNDKIFTVSYDKTVRIWKLEPNRLTLDLKGHDSPITTAVYSPDYKKVAAAAYDGTVRIWDAQSGSLLKTLVGHEDIVENAAFSADGKLLVTSSKDNTAKVWDTREWKTLFVLTGHCVDEFKFGEGGCGIRAQFSTDNRYILTAADDTTARIWDVRNGTLLHELKGHDLPVVSSAFNPDSTKVVTGSEDMTAKVWDVKTGNMLAVLSGHKGAIFHSAFSPDGKIIATASDDDTTIRLWDAATGTLARVLSGHYNRVSHINFSSDSQLLISIGWNSARVWNIKSGKERGRLSLKNSVMTFGALSKDNKLVATNFFSKGSVGIWDLASSKLRQILVHDSSDVNSVEFGPLGRKVLTSTQSGQVKIWNIFPLQSLIDKAKRDSARCLTIQQLEKFYLPSQPPRWCITGPGFENEKDPSKWKPKWPYHTSSWKEWLLAKDAGKNSQQPTQ